MKTANDIAIRLSHVSKRYTRYPGGYRLVSRIHHEKPTLVERLANGKDEEFWVYKDVNLTKSFPPLGQSPFSLAS